jgi:hypothetical protein
MHGHMNVKIQSDKSHGVSCTRETESVQHTCKIFNCKSDHMLHIVSQLGEMPFYCPECGNCFKDESVLFKYNTYGGIPTALCNVWKVF